MAGRSSQLDPAFERALRDVLFDRALPCPHCRYDLRGLVGTRCPECGRDVEHHLRVADLSPERLRRQKLENRVRIAVRVFWGLLAAAPFVVIAVWAARMLL